MIKVGDKVKLVNDEGIGCLHPVRKNRVYEVFGFYKDNIEIIRDNGTIFGYRKDRFVKMNDNLHKEVVNEKISD